jgi:hypothetical protein
MITPLVRARQQARPGTQRRKKGTAVKLNLGHIRIKYKTSTPALIHADTFQPFASRVGIDTVVRLQFDYNPALVSRLKALLSVYRVGAEHKTIGGWLPKFKCWFVEAEAWEIVRMELLYLGHRVMERKP